MDEKAMAYIDHIKEDLGDGAMRDGVLAGIEQGYFQREIQDAAYDYQERVEDGEETVVGVNAYTVQEETEPEILQVDETVQERQRERLADVKASRDDGAVEATLSAVREATENDENVVPAIIEAVKVGTTMGEVMGVFEDHYGTYRETGRTA